MEGKSITVVGAQWGDEGKGKIIDHLTADADVVVRFQGGNNAGHTLVIDGEKHVLHLVPSGALHPGKKLLIGPNVVADLAVLHQEIILAERHGCTVLVDDLTGVIHAGHRAIDNYRENASPNKIGTTGRGIGPAYEDWHGRTGLRMYHLLDPGAFSRVTRQGWLMDRTSHIRPHVPLHPLTLEIEELAHEHGEFLRTRVGDTRAEVHRALSGNQSVLFEGAQGVMLDIGIAQPYSTSSFCTAGAVAASMHVYGSRVIGVAKAYCTRVGRGPFPTEIEDGSEMSNVLREKGGEYGATTGRPRRCGWLDLPQLRFACRASAIDELVITKLDILSDLPVIPICTNYLLDGQPIDQFATLTADLLSRVKPVMGSLPGWTESLHDCRGWNDLPLKARQYIQLIEREVGVHVTLLGVGPERDQVIECE